MQLIAKKGVKLFRDYYIDMEILPTVLPDVIKIPTACGSESVIWQKTIGDAVQKYEVIATLNQDIPVYSPCSGVFKEISVGPMLGDINGMQYAVIETRSDDTPISPMWNTDDVYTKDKLTEIIRKAAIINESSQNYLYSFLNPSCQYEKIIIDAVDEQPFDLSRTATLLSYKNEVIGGAKIMAKAFGITNIELLAMKNFRTSELFKTGVDDIELIKVGGKYPLASVISQYTDSNNGLLVGAQCCRAVYRAAVFGEPQLSNAVTVWGNGVECPAILEVLNGTPVDELLLHCHANGILERVVGGGVMKGYSASPAFPLFRWDSALTAMLIKKHHKTAQCINCGRCASVCPMGLAPYYITRSSKKIGERRAKELCAELCINCGACSYICPSRISLNALIKSFKKESKGEEKA